jgi:hypothetical protein
MGLDLALGVLVLLAAIRGWFRGFVFQAIRLGGLVSSVYLAAPVRDLVRPFAREHLATIRPELLDKLLWWACAVASYVVTTGVATWTVTAYRRRRTYTEPDTYRGDQSAGALLGAAKGVVVIAFLAAGIEHYSPEYVKTGGWAGDQVQTSQVLAWNRDYHPASRIWGSPPVQMFVEYIRRMGLQPLEEELEKGAESVSPVQTASRASKLELPAPADRLDPRSPDFDLDTALDLLKEEARGRDESR